MNKTYLGKHGNHLNIWKEVQPAASAQIIWLSDLGDITKQIKHEGKKQKHTKNTTKRVLLRPGRRLHWGEQGVVFLKEGLQTGGVSKVTSVLAAQRVRRGRLVHTLLGKREGRSVGAAVVTNARSTRDFHGGGNLKGAKKTKQKKENK